MVHVLDTTRIFLDEETSVLYTRRLVMPYSQITGPLEDVSYLWEDQEHVTSFQDEFGEKYHVLEPLQKVLDGWLCYLEQLSSSTIKFSAS